MKKHKYIFLTIIWMAFIFYMSHQDGTVSSNSSLAVTNSFLHFLPFSTFYTYMLETIIRKSAHVVAFAILAFLNFQAIRPYTKKVYRYTFILSFVYACIDEIHQYFIPGRSALFTDVLIDSIGIILTLLALYLFHQKKAQQNTNKKKII